MSRKDAYDLIHDKDKEIQIVENELERVLKEKKRIWNETEKLKEDVKLWRTVADQNELDMKNLKKAYKEEIQKLNKTLEWHEQNAIKNTLRLARLKDIILKLHEQQIKTGTMPYCAPCGCLIQEALLLGEEEKK